MANYHVSKDKDSGQWNVQKAGGKNASGSADTQKAAEKMAKELAANSGGGEVLFMVWMEKFATVIR